VSKSSIADSPRQTRLICPQCRKQSTRKWNPDKSPYGFGWCRRCVPHVLVVRYEAPCHARKRAWIQKQVQM